MSHRIALWVLAFHVWMVGAAALIQGIQRLQRPPATPYGPGDAWYGLFLIALVLWVMLS